MTEGLIQLGLKGFAVEPNQAMREEGAEIVGNDHFVWQEGSGEKTGLSDQSVNWVLMASSFHWTDQEKALQEFARILRPGGFFTAIWNPRDVEKNELHQTIERKIESLIPDLKRVSSGAKVGNIEDVLTRQKLFGNLIYMEGMHEVQMDQERYLGAWRSVNDIQAQAGPDRFAEILDFVKEITDSLPSITVPYKTRAWTVQKL